MIRILCLLICCCGSIWAQKGLKLSDSRERDQTDRSYSIIDYDSSRIAVLRFEKNYRYAETEVYDWQLDFKNNFRTTDRRRRYGGVINLNGTPHMLYSRYRLNNRLERYENVSLYALALSRDSFQVAEDSITLIPPKNIESPYYRGNFVVSPDRSKLLIYNYEEDGDIEEVKGLTNTINLRVFDQDLNLLWKRSVDLSPNQSGKRLIAIKKLRISNDGEVAIMTDYFRDQRSYALKIVTADPTLFFVGKEKKHFMRFTPNLGEYFFNELDFRYDFEGNIIWAGFYSKYKYYQQGGTFYIKINAERNKILQKRLQPFSDELIKELLNKKKVPNKPEVHHYKLLHFRLMPNGDLILSAEFQPYGINNFKSHSILLMRFSNTGELLWDYHYYKINAFPDRLKVFLEHYLYIHNDQVYLLFNDGLYEDTGKAMVLRVDKDGKATKRQLFAYKNQTTLICPTLSYPLPNGNVFLSLQSRYFKYYQFGLLNLEALFK